MANLTRIAAAVMIVVALLLGIYAWTLSRRPPPALPAARVTQPTFPIVVATRVLPAGKPIPPDALRVQALPIHPAGTFADPALLVDRVPLADIGSDAPVLESQLSSGFAEQIEPGERAVAVKVDETSAVGNRVRPGNLVDVFFTLKRDASGMGGAGEVDRSQARLLLSKVRVLAFGNAGPAGGAAGEPVVNARTAVLAVPTADVDQLALAQSAGQIVLALRNPRDVEVADPSAFAPLPGVMQAARDARDDPPPSTRAAAGVALAALSGSGGTRAPTPARPVVAPARVAATHGAGIEVIRAGRAETVAY